MDREPVDSSALRSVAYDERARELEVEFTSGNVYRYDGVEPEVARELLEAPSKGSFFNARIRDDYPYQRAEGPGRRKA
ncbi:MAG TPA: KTSC domain-containing protein [Deinococcales bacterium]|nr:KTSC domain-containing protein [Deinococcales bacterium]